MLTGLWDRIQLSIFLMKALFNNYFVALMLKSICKLLIFSKNSTFNFTVKVTIISVTPITKPITCIKLVLVFKV